MSNKKTQIFDTLIGLIPLFILIYLDPEWVYIYAIGLLIYIIYLSLKPKIKKFWKRFILNELDEKEYLKNIKKISEITTSKTVTRRAREGGYETLDFTMKYNPNVQKFNLRLFAKVLDIALYYFLIYLFSKYIKNFDIYILFVSFLSTMLINPILETLTGRTFGKLITGLQVVDEKCEFYLYFKILCKKHITLFQLIIVGDFTLPTV